MKFGITGHQHLKDPSAWKWVDVQIDCLLSKQNAIPEGLTSLAIGADSLFAEAILRHNGSLYVIVPFEGYESKFSEGADREKYFKLLEKATYTKILRKSGSDEEAYLKAGERIVDMADMLVAVWDGKPAAGLGGTADIVEYATQRHKPILHLNPITRTINKI
jgi:hypothetical protein